MILFNVQFLRLHPSRIEGTPSKKKAYFRLKGAIRNAGSTGCSVFLPLLPSSSEYTADREGPAIIEHAIRSWTVNAKNSSSSPRSS